MLGFEPLRWTFSDTVKYELEQTSRSLNYCQVKKVLLLVCRIIVRSKRFHCLYTK
jgi:hypothetical protein